MEINKYFDMNDTKRLNDIKRRLWFISFISTFFWRHYIQKIEFEVRANSHSKYEF